MNLKTSKKKLPKEKKDQMESFLFGFLPTIHKSNLNTESYKSEKPINEEEEKTSLMPILSGLKSQTAKIFSYLSGIKNIANNNNQNVSKNTNNNLYSISYPKIINSNNEETKNKNIEIGLAKNIDQQTIFKPSLELIKNINEKFNTSLNEENIVNITKRPIIPALRKGGVVKEPTVSYLHENEAVIPLKESKQFSEVIKIISEQTKNNISKNERINNTADMRSYSTNRSMTQSKSNSSSNKESKSAYIDNRSMPVSFEGTGGGKETLEAKIPTVYAGSASTSEFFVNSARLPSWRSSIG